MSSWPEDTLAEELSRLKSHPEPPQTALEVLAHDHSSRKRFLTMVGGAGAASAFSLLLAACGSSSDSSANKTRKPKDQAPSGAGDLDIVNFALTLEYLESDFYKRVLASGFFNGKRLDLFKLISSDEEQHVAALKATASKLGSPVPRPQANFPMKDPGQVLELASTLENTGAAAYLGQADKIENNEILAAALSIHTIEARHAAELNRLTGKPITPDGALAGAMSRDQVMQAVRPFIA